MAKKDAAKSIISFITHATAALFGWALLSLVHAALTDWLFRIGVESQVGQYGVIAGGALVILLLLGVGINSALKNI